MNRFTCDWIFNILVVLSDGKVVCGCADPCGERPLGSLGPGGKGLPDIWNSPIVQEIRRGLNAGHSPFCLPCGLKRPLPEGTLPPQRPLSLERLPRIFFEPTVLCNLSCFEAVCSRESGIIRTRSRASFPLEEFKGLIDEVGRNLIRLDFFNYGDPFVHPQAVDMIEYLKAHHPRTYLYTSTNGLMLTENKIRRIVDASLDEITFSVDGPDQRTYARYRRGGDFRKVMSIIRDFVRLRDASGKDLPFINWRYILFRWNDSRWKMARARRLASRVGVDRLTWEITDHPRPAVSKKYQVGTGAWKKIFYEIWDSSQIGTALAGKRYLAGIRPPEGPLAAPAQAPLRIEVEVRNRGGALWPERTPSGRGLVRLGAQLHDDRKKMLELNYARAFLPRPLDRKEEERIVLELPPVGRPGTFWLKFDMVSEGIDWFENGGSPVAWLEFRALP